MNSVSKDDFNLTEMPLIFSVKQPIKTLWAGLGSGRMQCYKLDVGRNRHDGVTMTPSKLSWQP